MRISKQEMFKQICLIVAQRSTCKRLKVGCIIVKDDRLVSSGWNGVASGKPHCEDVFKDVDDIYSQDFLREHAKFSKENEFHAEENAILFYKKNSEDFKDADIYVTISPCITCAKLIERCGIKRVFYIDTYDRSIEGLVFLEKNNISINKI